MNLPVNFQAVNMRRTLADTKWHMCSRNPCYWKESSEVDRLACAVQGLIPQGEKGPDQNFPRFRSRLARFVSIYSGIWPVSSDRGTCLRIAVACMSVETSVTVWDYDVFDAISYDATTSTASICNCILSKFVWRWQRERSLGHFAKWVFFDCWHFLPSVQSTGVASKTQIARTGTEAREQFSSNFSCGC